MDALQYLLFLASNKLVFKISWDWSLPAAVAAPLDLHLVDRKWVRPDPSCQSQPFVSQCLLHTPQLLPEIQAFAVLSAVPKANSTWGMSSKHCDTMYGGSERRLLPVRKVSLAILARHKPARPVPAPSSRPMDPSKLVGSARM